MSAMILFAVLLSLIFLSAIFSGSETGIYSHSRIRLEAEARQGKRSARLLRRLLRDDSGMLITLLIGNNLMLELLTHLFELKLVPPGLPSWSDELLVTLILTPLVFLFGELFPKDLFRRRSHSLLVMVSPVLWVARIVFWPLAKPLQWLSQGLAHLTGQRESGAVLHMRREEMLDILREGTRSGALAPRAESLARNVLVLRETPVERIMLPWAKVVRINLDEAEPELRSAVGHSQFTRIPVYSLGDASVAEARRAKPRVVGYLHQLEVLASDGKVGESLRELPSFEPSMPVDRALARLRMTGQRLALVGTPQEPKGLVTLMDFVGMISRESKPQEPTRVK